MYLKLLSPLLNYRKLKSKTQEEKGMVQSEFFEMNVKGFMVVVVSSLECSPAQSIKTFCFPGL